jgi:adenylyl-sulfate kinase
VPDRVLSPLERARHDLALLGRLPTPDLGDDRLVDDEGAPVPLSPPDVGRSPIYLRGPVAPAVLAEHDHVVLLTDRPRADDSVRLATVRAVAALGLPVTVLLDPGPEVTAAGAPVSVDSGGAVVLLTGLSGSGKSTIARALVDVLDPPVTLLDGDVVRRHLSRGLGFSKEDRDTNVARIGWVAAEVAKHGGTVVCAPIAPYAETRERVRRMAVEAGARFLLVWVSTPLAVCEGRDRKGLYAAARRGEISGFTGIDDPYEEPTDADLVIDASVVEVADAVGQVTALLGART